MNLKERNKKAYEQIKNAKKILLTTHGKPDGDAVSSVCTMMLLLTDLNKYFVTYCSDPAPEPLHFLPFTEKIETDINKVDFASFDLIVPVDCGSLSRTNLSVQIKNRNTNQYVVEFDHHPKVDDYADLEIRDPLAASSTEVLYGFFRDNDLKINKQVANCILTGILTDTGNFLYPSTTDKTINIASEMLLCGAKYPLITEETWRNKSIGAMKLWGKAIGALEINKKYNLAFTVIKYKDILESACNNAEMEGISGFLSNLYGINGLLLIRETADGTLKGSLRTTHPDIDISKLANRLGGGGHKKASGFVLHLGIAHGESGWRVS